MSPFAKRRKKKLRRSTVYALCRGIHNACLISHMLSTEAVVQISSIPSAVYYQLQVKVQESVIW